MQLLSTKPLQFTLLTSPNRILANSDGNNHVTKLRAHAVSENRKVTSISAAIEAELSTLSSEDRKEYLDSLGVSDSGVNGLIKLAFEQLGLKTYFTAGEKEVRAWPFEAGMTAPQCAGIIPEFRAWFHSRRNHRLR